MKKKLIQSMTTGGQNFSINLRDVAFIFPVTFDLFTTLITKSGSHVVLAEPLREVLRKIPEKSVRWEPSNKVYEVTYV